MPPRVPPASWPCVLAVSPGVASPAQLNYGWCMFSAKQTEIATPARSATNSKRILNRAFLMAALVALVAVTCLYELSSALHGEIVVDGQRGATEVSIGPVILATALGALCALGLAWGALRTPWPRRVLVLAIAAGLVLSSLPPLAATTSASTLWLLAMHVVVAVPLVAWALRYVWDATAD